MLTHVSFRLDNWRSWFSGIRVIWLLLRSSPIRLESYPMACGIEVIWLQLSQSSLRLDICPIASGMEVIWLLLRLSHSRLDISPKPSGMEVIWLLLRSSHSRWDINPKAFGMDVIWFLLRLSRVRWVHLAISAGNSSSSNPDKSSFINFCSTTRSIRRTASSLVMSLSLSSIHLLWQQFSGWKILISPDRAVTVSSPRLGYVCFPLS